MFGLRSTRNVLQLVWIQVNVLSVERMSKVI